MLIVLVGSSSDYQVENTSWNGFVLSTLSIEQETFAGLSCMSSIGMSEICLFIAEIAR